MVDDIEELVIEIDKMRKAMCNLVNKKSNLLNSKVVQASQNLDEVLNSYHKLLESKKRK